MRFFKYALIVANVLLFLAAVSFLLLRLPTGSEQGILLVLFLLMGAANFLYYVYFRKRFVLFSENICRNAERIMREEEVRQPSDVYHQETLTSKVVMELEKMEDVVQNRAAQSEEEKAKLQKTISEISHQLKTPLSNIRMYYDMISDPDLTEEEEKRFRQVIRQQLEKLEFLIDSLMKSSRLESDMIRLNIEENSVFHTLEAAVNGILQKADRKKIDLAIDCRQTIRVPHDMKWTAEAIGNILDNAVKYTDEQGKVSLRVVSGEMYIEIQIRDTGKGIAPEHYNDIFKRFYRETSVSKEEGLGLGLSIARNIISLQGGHIMVRSEAGKGSCFSVFLPKRKLT